MPNITEALQASAQVGKTEKKKNGKRKSFSSGKFYSTTILLKNSKAVIEFPKSIIDYFDLNPDNPEIYWTPINGVIQLSGREPGMVIPMISVNADEFIPEKERN